MGLSQNALRNNKLVWSLPNMEGFRTGFDIYFGKLGKYFLI